ncbi:MAG: hypothetical protein HWE30_18530 [Methylocystaceae bacterium]|nr:hypothetical protein [Methylocystaceae bacterium]
MPSQIFQLNIFLFLFPFFLIFGWKLRNNSFLQAYLPNINLWVLYVFVFIIASNLDLQKNVDHWLILAIGGFFIQAVPTLLGLLLPEKNGAFWTWGTYGGGNRGVLALSFFAPSLIPAFIVADLANFASLTTIYTFFQKQKTNISSLIKAIYPIVFLSIGFLFYETGYSQHIPNTIDNIVSLIIKISVPLQIGMQINVPPVKEVMFIHLTDFFVVRALIFSPIALVYFIGFDWALVLLVFATLPSSSLSVLLCKESIRVQATIVASLSNALYVFAMLLLIIIYSCFNL